MEFLKLILHPFSCNLFKKYKNETYIVISVILCTKENDEEKCFVLVKKMYGIRIFKGVIKK